MTKKDYIKFADMIAREKANNSRYFVCNDPENHNDKCHEKQIALIQDAMIEIFKQDNPNFDDDKFNKYIEQKAAQLTR